MVNLRVMLMDFQKASMKEMRMASQMVDLRVLERLKALMTELMTVFLMGWRKALLKGLMTELMMEFQMD